jgi:hypothetical protein
MRAQAISKVTVDPSAGLDGPVDMSRDVQVDVWSPGERFIVNEPLFVPRPGAAQELGGGGDLTVSTTAWHPGHRRAAISGQPAPVVSSAGPQPRLLRGSRVGRGVTRPPGCAAPPRCRPAAAQCICRRRHPQVPPARTTAGC